MLDRSLKVLLAPHPSSSLPARGPKSGFGSENERTSRHKMISTGEWHIGL